MPSTTGLSLEQLQAKRKELMAQGKELSTSKELGKIENAIKVLNPSKYDDKQVASAQLSLKSSTQAPTTGVGTSVGGDLEKLLADKQAALVKATQNINDNPWYSEATRVGKLAKLNNIAQLEISNIQNQLAQKKQDVENAKPKTSLQTFTDSAGNVTSAVINTETGEIISQNNLGSIGSGANKTTGGGTSSGGSSDKTPSSNKYLNTATKYLNEADIEITGKGTEDKLLSRDEQMRAYNRVLALVGGDATLAQQVFQQAWDTGGYGNYGE